DGGGEGDQCEEVLRLLLPADEQLAATSETRRHAFNHPAPLATDTLTGAPLFTAPANSRAAVEPAHRPAGVAVVVALVQTHSVHEPGRRAHHAGVEQGADGLLVGAVRRSEGNRDR